MKIVRQREINAFCARKNEPRSCHNICSYKVRYNAGESESEARKLRTAVDKTREKAWQGSSPPKPLLSIFALLRLVCLPFCNLFVFFCSCLSSAANCVRRKCNLPEATATHQLASASRTRLFCNGLAFFSFFFASCRLFMDYAKHFCT